MATIAPMSLAVLGWNVVQTGVTHFQDSDSAIFETAYKVREFFYAFNITALCISIYELVDSAPFFDRVIVPIGTVIYDLAGPVWGEFITVFSPYVLGGVCIFLIVKSVSYINERFKPTEQLDQWRGGEGAAQTADFCRPHSDCDRKLDVYTNSDYKITWGNPFYQEMQQGLYITNLVIQVALIFFSSNPYICAFNIAMLCYNLVKTTGWRWIQTEREFDYKKTLEFEDRQVIHSTNHRENDTSDLLLSLKVSNFFPLMKPKTGTCTVCSENGELFGWCNEDGHGSCIECTAGNLYGKSSEILTSSEITFISTTVERSGGITERYRQYEIDLNKESLPSCPFCRAVGCSDITIETQDRYLTHITTREARVLIGGEETVYSKIIRFFREQNYTYDGV